MKKLLLSLAIVSMVSGCALFRSSNTDSGVTSETTASGGTVAVDSSMGFAATGSDAGLIPGVQTVRFKYDSDVLSDGEQQKLEGNAQWLKTNSSAQLIIEGHCDQRGSTEYNLALGERRANKVKQMLVGLGIAGNRLSTVSYGKERPLTRGESESDLALNRRANFVAQ
ncbi:OmpA family protein [Pseudobdellovibrio exovorus]|uniref:Peptidoglycan-associated lipoprotein n=1 Tax=Pseudobdellovibrio exovorus JSS TaxID=1184267 RepID=M4VCS0_9BACT|nr:OmpA family protein [Pseudobdellovibrio exovorus]AGH96285.1 peptidoglycan-associated lipoprotein [Pseudobdellovibrio exovorus JSS]